MLTPDEFPYIKSLYVNYSYADRDFNIELYDYKPFSHLILTGRNESGKSTVLLAVDNHIQIWRGSIQQGFLVQIYDPSEHLNRLDSFIRREGVNKGIDHLDIVSKRKELEKLNRLNLQYAVDAKGFWLHNKDVVIYSFLKAKRESTVASVTSVTKEADFTNKLSSSESTETFIKRNYSG